MIPGTILAGGLSRRMGADKALVPFGSRRMIDHAVARLAPQVGALAVNANGDAGRFAGLALPVIADSVQGWPGPLAGMLAALDWAAALGADRVATVAVDVPFLPRDFVARLGAAGGAAVAVSGGRMHPVCGLWPVAARDGLRAAVAAGLRRVRDWDVVAGAAQVEFPAGTFVNLNTPADVAAAEARM